MGATAFSRQCGCLVGFVADTAPGEAEMIRNPSWGNGPGECSSKDVRNLAGLAIYFFIHDYKPTGGAG